MAKANKLTARGVETAKPGKHSDGGGLSLVVSSTGAKKWVLRYGWRGKTARELGLGSYPAVPLAAARQKALEARQQFAAGVDPIEARKRDRGVPTFGALADEVLAIRAAAFTSPRHVAQWERSFKVYCAPIRSKPVDQIDVADVLAVLKPHWTRAPKVAPLLRARIEVVLDAAKARKHRTGENPARWRGNLEHWLTKPDTSNKHYPAIDYGEAPAFVARLRKKQAGSTAALALEFKLLTGVRTQEARLAKWGQFDLDAAVWTIPAENMKADREHRVPLSDRALAIIRQMQAAGAGPYVFPGQDPGRPLAQASIPAVLRRMGVNDVSTVHGWRTTFRSWGHAETDFPRELLEEALAHAVGKVERAYLNRDALERRHVVMQRWADYLEGEPAAENVVKFGRRPA